MLKRALYALLVGLLLLTASPVSAQTSEPPKKGPVYIVQAGDTLWDIASRFDIALDDLMAANELTDADVLSVGQELVIPGLEGVSGILRTETVPYGDTLRSLQRRTQAPQDVLRKLNRLVSPTELYAGVSLIIPQEEGQPALSARASLAPGETLLELAVAQGSDPWVLAEVNRLEGTWAALPGDVLYSPSSQSDQNANGLPAAFASAEVETLPLVQGGTAEIRVALSQPATLSGHLGEYPLRFFPMEDGNYVALQGIHALLEPGAYPLQLEATLADGSTQSFEQMVLVISGNYPHERIVVPPDTIDQTVSETELEQLLEIVSEATPRRLWDGVFQNPSLYPDCFTSRYGTRRTYIGQGTSLEVEGFHSGLDFCGGEGLQITAPADGVVVFADETVIRGNATIIDHGWGVYSGYWHQSEIDVRVGDQVEAGQVIGLVGGTGRVTGAHLHWEIWVNNVQVNPMDWLEQEFP